MLGESKMPVLHICSLEDREEHFCVFQEFRDRLIIGRRTISLAAICETRLDQGYHFLSFPLVQEVEGRLTELCVSLMHPWLKDGLITC